MIPTAESPHDTWRSMFNAAFSYTGDTFYDISDQLSKILFGLLDVKFGQIVPPSYPEHITFHICSHSYTYSTDDDCALPESQLLAVIERGDVRLYVSHRRPEPKAEPKLNTWRKVFEAAFERTGESWDIFQNPYNKFPRTEATAFPIGFFDAEFGKPFRAELPKGWRIDHVDEANFLVKSKHYFYSTYPSGESSFIVEDDIGGKPRLYVKSRAYPGIDEYLNPPDNFTPPGITREEVEYIRANMRYLEDRLITMDQKILELQGGHNDGS